LLAENIPSVPRVAVLHGGFCFQIPAIVEVHIAEKCIDIIDAFEDIPQVLFDVSKRQEPPPAKLVYGQAPPSILLQTDRRSNLANLSHGFAVFQS
jgi:hypothetical protein